MKDVADHFGIDMKPPPTEMELAEAEFAARMDAAPDDDTTRLVFADWLDEAGRANEAAGYRALVNGRLRPYGRCWSSYSVGADDSSVLPWRWRFGPPDFDITGNTAPSYPFELQVGWEYLKPHASAYAEAARLYPGNDDPVILLDSPVFGSTGYLGQFRRERGFTPEQMPTVGEVTDRYMRDVVAGRPLTAGTLPPRFNLVAMDTGDDVPPWPPGHGARFDYANDLAVQFGYMTNRAGRIVTVWAVDPDTGRTRPHPMLYRGPLEHACKPS